MSVSRQQVKTLAHLARLALQDAELEAMTRDMEQLVAFADQLGALDLSAAPPMEHVLPMVNVLREDGEPRPFSREEALRNAPQAEGDCFAVPRVVE